MSTNGSPAPDDAGPPPRKSTLFCPACDHRSPLDGDWRVEAAEGGRRFVCPDCGATVTTRPTAPAGDANDDARPTRTVTGVSLLAASVVGWHRAAAAWVEAVAGRAH
jgi:hypothetical protein